MDIFSLDPVAFCSTESEVPEWIHILPSGQEIRGKDGRSWRVSNLQAIIEKTLRWNNGSDIPVDYEHQSEKETSKPLPVPAAGWIKQLEVRSNGIWARVEWTSKATELIRNREYRYLSPTFTYFVNSQEIERISSVALVHHPNLALTALNKVSDMNTDLKKQLYALLELPDDADESAIIEAIKKLKQDMQKDYNSLSALPAIADALSALNSEKAMMTQQRHEEKISHAISSGVIPPSLRNWAKDLCSTSEKTFNDFVDTIGKPFAYLSREAITPEMEAELHTSLASGRNSIHISDTELVAKQLGIDSAKLK